MTSLRAENVQIDAGNQKFDMLTLIFFAAILLVLFLLSITVNFEFGYLFIIFLPIAIFHKIRITSRHYIFLSGDTILIKHLFKRDVTIHRKHYIRISASCGVIPFMNEMMIHFDDGRCFLFSGGTATPSEIERLILGYWEK